MPSHMLWGRVPDPKLTSGYLHLFQLALNHALK